MQRLPAAQGGAAKSKAMTPVMDFAAGRVRATPCARSPTGVLGGLFQTPLYHLRPVGVPSRHIQGGYGHPALSPHTGHPVHNILSVNEGRDKSRRDSSGLP